MKAFFNTLSILPLIVSFIGGQAAAQYVQVCLGDDVAICPGQTVRIVNCNPAQSGGLVLTNPQVIPQLSDDQWSGVRNIGFTFNFYGNNHTQFIIGSNGVVSFNIGQANGFCPWGLGGVGDVDFFTVTNNPTLHFGSELSISYWFKQCSFQGMNGWGATLPSGNHVIMAKAGDGFAAQPGIFFMQNGRYSEEHQLILLLNYFNS